MKQKTKEWLWEVIKFFWKNKNELLEIKRSIEWLDTKEELEKFIEWLDKYVESCKS